MGNQRVRNPVGTGIDLAIAQRLAFEHQGHGIGPFGCMGLEAAEGKCVQVICIVGINRSLHAIGTVGALPQPGQLLHFFRRQHRQAAQRLHAAADDRIDQLYQRPLQIARDPAGARAIGAAGRSEALERFSPERYREGLTRAVLTQVRRDRPRG